LQAAFGRWRLALLVFCALPAALIGGLLAVAADGGVSPRAAAGVYAGFSLSARNLVALIATPRPLRPAPGAASPDPPPGGGTGPRRSPGPPAASSLVIGAARERLGPIVTSAVAIAAVLLPLVIAGDVAGNEMTHSAAAVVLGGLITSTLFSLLVAPAICAR